jgi:hypothetical protein
VFFARGFLKHETVSESVLELEVTGGAGRAAEGKWLTCRGALAAGLHVRRDRGLGCASCFMRGDGGFGGFGRADMGIGGLIGWRDVNILYVRAETRVMKPVL